jgi:hypothetical protein
MDRNNVNEEKKHLQVLGKKRVSFEHNEFEVLAGYYGEDLLNLWFRE